MEFTYIHLVRERSLNERANMISLAEDVKKRD